MNALTKLIAGLLLSFLCLHGIAVEGGAATIEKSSVPAVKGLTGRVNEIHVAVEAPQAIAPLSAADGHHDLDLQRMAAWAMNYLIRTPKKELNYEPVFQCHPLRCPPVPPSGDVVVACDTDARMNIEWYYMREVSGSSAGKGVEEAFHQRMLSYVQEDGTVLCHPGCYNEGDINKVYQKADYVYHVWGATKIMHALAEDFRRTGNEQSRITARKIMLRLKKLAVYPTPDQCYLPAGMGGMRQDGTVVTNSWNKQPAPLVEPLLNYYLTTGDKEALSFAKAYAEGIMAGIQPGGIRFGADGNFGGGHGHATLHALWGVARLGLVTGEPRYLTFVKRSWDWMRTQGTGTGWFPAGPLWADDCNETCCISDMLSIAALLGESGHTEYYDYVERYLRNYISNLQFIVTPGFETYYREINAAAGKEEVDRGLKELRKFQGGIIGGSGLNDFENRLLGGTSGFEMFGCCAPEGMRAIHTAWDNVIERSARSERGPAGVYVNLSLGRESKWGRVVSFYPDAGRLTVKAGVKDRFFLRPPHWAPREQVRAFVGARSVPVKWSGAYVHFDKVAPGDEITITYPLIHFSHEVEGLWSKYPEVKMTFQWLGNSVVGCDPLPDRTPLFIGRPRLLPAPLLDELAGNQE
jgi:hypothetical protein